MHILHLIKTSEGASWALNQMKEIKAAYPEITFSVAVPSDGRYFEEYKTFCKSVYEFNFTIGIMFLKNGLALRKIVKKDKPDIIHSWFTQTTLYARLFLHNLNVPRIFQVVGPLHLENRIFKYGDIISAKKNDYWIATSKYIYNKYKQSGITDEKIFFNYAYSDLLKLIENGKNMVIQNFKEKFNIPSDYSLIGTASYVYAPKFYQRNGVKGHEFLLKAFKIILTKRKNIALIISGAPFGNSLKYYNRLKKIAKDIDPKRIIFTGEYNYVYEIISNFDLFVYLSKSENLGGVYESLLFEIPTIASNKGALPELVIPGKTGYIVEPSDVNTVAETIINALKHDNSEFKKNGKNLVIKTFDKNNIIENTLKIYNSILEQNIVLS